MDNIVKSAADKFALLIEEQLKRVEKMKQEKDFIDYKELDTIVIGICGGDGIGPRITGEAQRVLQFLLKEEEAKGKIKFNVIEDLTIEKRAEVGKAIPDSALAELK